MHNRGQVTLFVILGVVFVILIALFIILTTRTTLLTASQQNTAEEKLEEVEAYIEDCVEQHLITGLQTVGIANISTYLASVNCNVTSLNDNTYTIQASNLTTTTQVTNESIRLTVTHPLTIAGNNSRVTLQPQHYQYSLITTQKIPTRNGRTTETVIVNSIATLSTLLIPEGTATTDSIQMRVSQGMEGMHVTLYETNGFTPYAVLRLHTPNRTAGEHAIIHEATHTSIPSYNERDYLSANITEPGDYFIGSCEEYICCWNGKCDASENYQTCGECEAPPEIEIPDFTGGNGNTTVPGDVEDPCETDPFSDDCFGN